MKERLRHFIDNFFCTQIAFLSLITPSVSGTADTSLVPYPNDPETPTQWHLGEQGTNWLNFYSRVESAGIKLRPVRVAIMDSGIQLDHPDFLPIDLEHSCGVIGQQFETLQCQPPEDEFGHGTVVAGQLIAKTDNALFGAGSLPGLIESPIIIQVMRPDGVANYSDISTGLEYLLSLIDSDIQIDVISMSIAGDPLAAISQVDENLIDVIKRQLQALNERGVIVLAGAGNDQGEATHFPANQPTVIDVGASTKDRNKSPASSFGDKDGFTWQILAPSKEVGSPCIYNDFCYSEGTSLATPQVAQAVAVIKSFRPSAKLEEIRSILYLASTPITAENSGQELEFRILDFEKLADQMEIQEINNPQLSQLFLALLAK